jgi:peroxisomal 3,2-trans-enoyl-CoA isomerase
MSVEESVLYEVKGKTAIITLNLPKIYNALGFDEYQRLDELVQKAARDPNTLVTLIQSTGKFFSAGANVTGGSRPHPDYDASLSQEENYKLQRRHFVGNFGARNLSITETFYRHPKVLVVALNGPVIGLSAALVALADFIYALDTTYFLVPFANIGLVAEGAASYSLVQRLGWTKANEALLASQPISAKDMTERGLVNKMFSSKEFSTEQFNKHVLSIVEKTFFGLDPNSIMDIKKLIHLSLDKSFAEANHAEVIGGIEKFSLGIPQKRFAALAAKSLRHKI